VAASDDPSTSRRGECGRPTAANQAVDATGALHSTSALVGASSVRQLDENLDSLAAPDLTNEELERIEAVLK